MFASRRQKTQEEVSVGVPVNDCVYDAAIYLAGLSPRRRRLLLRAAAEGNLTGIQPDSPIRRLIDALRAGDLATALSRFTGADPVDFFFGSNDTPIRGEEIADDVLLPVRTVLAHSLQQWTELALSARGQQP